MSDNNQDWQKHLDDLDEHYAPDNFFIDQLTRPSNEANVREHFFPPTLFEEAELPEEGELSVDIFQDEDNLYVLAPIAGIKPEKLDLVIDRDVLTIRGEREKDLETSEKNYLYHECYWGKFSRSIILPLPVIGSEVQAVFKNGVLKVILPKAPEARAIGIKVQGEE